MQFSSCQRAPKDGFFNFAQYTSWFQAFLFVEYLRSKSTSEYRRRFEVEKLDAIRNPSLRWPLRSSKWPTQNWKYDAGPHGVWCWQGWVLSLAWEWGLVVSVGRPELDLGDDRHSTVTSATLLLRLLLLVRNEPATSIGSLYYQKELPGEALVIIIRMSQIFGTFWNHRFWVLLYDRKALRPSLGTSNCRVPCWPGLQS